MEMVIVVVKKSWDNLFFSNDWNMRDKIKYLGVVFLNLLRKWEYSNEEAVWVDGGPGMEMIIVLQNWDNLFFE